MRFKEWLKLKENGTFTNSVASFSNRIFANPIKLPPGNLPSKKKKKHKNKSR